ncbi:MBL fold metallo-hydrolase [Caminibacter mediatlanticus TB-2]|uniref:Ribonuclease Z n=1 Tax=Caminibacter mediatlanticus TB-2 TaxID=391592 RepID=A0ABX5V708_9BACT|nr:ribonuclease Z [Caminibacter mediatlanticus]QCT94055.1 MBL fold metallo-hydrolase [Caminibacter mediatlanticus TB-2]
MKFLFLGTSAGRPTKTRNVSGLVVEFENDNGWYLFDCGEATQHQILKTTYSLNKLKSIFITHLHGDHCYGLFGLITTKMMEKSSSPLKIYAPRGLKEMIESCVDIRFEHLGYEIEFIEIFGGFEEEFDKFSIKVLPLIHSIESYAYFIKQKDKFNLNKELLQKDGLAPSNYYKDLKEGKEVIVNGVIYKPEKYLIKKEGKKVIIAGDNAEPDILVKYLNNLDLLIHEATYTQEVFDNLEIKYLHTTAKNLGEVAKRYNVKNLIATHISPRYEGYEILEEIKKFYNGNVFVANDFDMFLLKDYLIYL